MMPTMGTVAVLVLVDGRLLRSSACCHHKETANGTAPTHDCFWPLSWSLLFSNFVPKKKKEEEQSPSPQDVLSKGSVPNG